VLSAITKTHSECHIVESGVGSPGYSCSTESGARSRPTQLIVMAATYIDKGSLDEPCLRDCSHGRGLSLLTHMFGLYGGRRAAESLYVVTLA